MWTVFYPSVFSMLANNIRHFVCVLVGLGFYFPPKEKQHCSAFIALFKSHEWNYFHFCCDKTGLCNNDGVYEDQVKKLLTAQQSSRKCSHAFGWFNHWTTKMMLHAIYAFLCPSDTMFCVSSANISFLSGH